MVKTKKKVGILVIVMMLMSILLTTVEASNLSNNIEFDKGPSYTSVVPLKKIAYEITY